MNTDYEPWKTDYIEACEYCNSREYEKALLKINKILSFDKNIIPARNLKASILIDSWNGDPKTIKNIFEAIDHLEAIIEKDPENKKIYFMNLGNAYYQFAKCNLESKGKLNLEIIKI